MLAVDRGLGAWWRSARLSRRLRRAPSSAQYLPSSIIQRIAHHVAAAAAAAADDGCRDSSGRSQGAHDRLTRAAQRMASVCRSWRVAVLVLFYQHFALDINCTAMWISPHRRMVYAACPSISDNVHCLARSVHITAPFAGVFTGKVVQILEANGHGGAVFPGVRQVWFNFYAGTTMQIEELEDAGRFAREFSRFVTARYPNATAYRFRVSLFADSDDSSMVGGLLAALLDDRRDRPLQMVEYVHESGGVRLDGLAAVVGLTHISIRDSADPADCVALVRRNAATLVSADLGIVDLPGHHPRLADDDDDGRPVTYPRLQALVAHASLVPPNTSAAFPALTALRRTTGSLYVANGI